jgi:hypothetical protein
MLCRCWGVRVEGRLSFFLGVDIGVSGSLVLGLDGELGLALRTEEAVARAYDGGAMVDGNSRSVRLCVFVPHFIVYAQ